MWIIDIHSCTDIRVTKIFRYIEQRDVLVDEDAGEGVSQVVEADVPHTVFSSTCENRSVTYRGGSRLPSLSVHT